MQQDNLSKNVFDTQELIAPSQVGDKLELPRKDTLSTFLGLDRPSGFELRRPSFDGRQIGTATIVNRTVNKFSKTYDAIVNASGGADFTSLEKAIAYVIAIGGGDIFVHAGTYVITTDISTLTVPINIIGVNSALTIINFNSTSRNFIANSGTPYTTGTITSATGTAVVGSSTAWLGNVTPGQYLLTRTQWYVITAVVDDTHITLGEPFSENFATFPGASYRIATLTRGIGFDGVTIKNSTGTALAFTDVRDINLTDVVLSTNNKGLVFTNCSNITINSSVVPSSTSNGCTFTNCGQFTVRGLASVGSAGHNYVFDTCELGSFLACNVSSSVGASSDGANISNCGDMDFNLVGYANGRHAVNLVAGNNAINISGRFRSSVSDTIKLTATSDYCKILDAHIDSSGAWAINIAAATCDKNLYDAISFNNNTSGNVTDSGTGTVAGNVTT